MNHYILIRRLRGPALLLLIGTIALLHSTGVIESFWRWFWPLLFILLGVLLLAERATLASGDGYPGWPCVGGPYPGGTNPNAPGGVPPYAGQGVPGQGTAIVPAEPHDFGKDPNGGQS
jgi:hypothetical protein